MCPSTFDMSKVVVMNGNSYPKLEERKREYEKSLSIALNFKLQIGFCVSSFSKYAP
jgi:hypothetical protein